MRLSIPYGQTSLPLDLPGGQGLAVLEPKHGFFPEGRDQDELVRAAMTAPLGCEPLEELARAAKNAVILCSDHTRPVPSRHIVPQMLAALRRGNPQIQISLLIATGCHRETTTQELRGKFGDEILQNERIFIHDCDDEANLISLGALPSGAELRINRLAAQTELLLAEGFIEPHFFAGFSGGRKSVLPGVCARATVLGNHCAAFIRDPGAVAGVLLGNPIQRDMEAAARMAKLRYIVNVILNGKKEVAAAFAGDALAAHEAGCAALRAAAAVRPPFLADIVISSNGGAPLDQNIYQAVKGMSTAEGAAAEGAVIILCAACEDGVGGEEFQAALARCESPAALLRQIEARSMEETLPDQWQVQILARILSRHTVIFVTNEALRPVVEEMKMVYAKSLDGALGIARAMKGEGARVAVIPDGVSLIVERS
ncbi:MAG: nickel-dependent lactate racemase [Christensenellaceae bacterium]|jgi:nickel-dependent lactate racemase|nr:nickel-dependent lactate racemase [Christensenellaceae bacterium]